MLNIERRADPVRPAPLSFGQRSLWFLHQLDPESLAYHVAKSWRLRGSLNTRALGRAVDALVRRHEPLRSCVRLVGDEPCQIVDPLPDSVFEYRDLWSESGGDPERQCRRIAVEEVRKPMDLENGPVFRVKLYRVAESEYVLLYITHHAFIDGWSSGVLMRDLSALYNAYVSDGEPALPELAYSYRDFAQWQREFFASSPDSGIAYWTRKLAGAPALLGLPTDRKRPAVQRYHGRRVLTRIDPYRTRQLKALARAAKATPFMVLLAAFKVLLYRFSGQADVCVGTPYANRSLSGVEDLIGLLVNTLVIRSRMEGDPPFTTLLNQVRNSVLEAFDHASTPVDRIVEALQVPRDLGYNPLFQVMFVFQNAPKHKLALDGAEVEDHVFFGADSAHQGIGAAKFDLSMAIEEDQGQLKCWMDYNTDLFVESTVQNLCRAFHTLIDSIVEDPDRTVSDLPLAGPVEEPWIVDQRGASVWKPGPDATIHARFARQADRSPDAVALCDADRRVSYGELDRWSSRVAGLLSEHGLAPGDVVGVLMPPSVARTAALLGVLKSGGIFLPLDHGHPPARLAAMASAAGTRLLVVAPETAGIGADLGPDTVELAGDDPGGEGRPVQIVPPELCPQVAYVMFTSGSTGAPKAVAGTHRGVVNRADWSEAHFPVGPGDVCCQRTNLGFVDAVTEIFVPLMTGAPSRVLAEEERADPAGLIEALARSGVTRITLTPVLLRAMLDLASRVARLEHLKLWICSGEALSADLRRRFYELLPNATLLNLYGCTEVAADATWFDCRDAEDGRRVPIGKPIDNTKVYILDDRMRPVPVGFPGEIYVAGAGVAAGYWRQEATTAERFLSNPFDPALEVMYKTGDIARRREDGNIEYLGRADRQVKFHGVRIEAEEVESMLAAHDSVRQAVVDVWEDERGKAFLVAWYVAAAGRSPDARELRQHLREMLPRQWLPSFFIQVDTLPQLPNGKIDRLSLPPPSRAGGQEQPVMRPADELESGLQRIWSELLGRDGVGVNEDFFDLGGHSILCFELLQRIETECGARLPVAAVFLAPTIAELAARIRMGVDEDPPDELLVAIRDEGGAAPLYCVPAAATTPISLGQLPVRFEGSQSFFGVQSLGFIDGTEPQDSVEVMARTYLEAIRKHQPKGPYYLGGRCFGGVVALEMAHQLIQSGAEVGLVVLLETAVPFPGLRRMLTPLTAGARLMVLARYPVDRLLARRARRDIADEFERNLSLVSDEVKKRMLDVDVAHRKALSAYDVKPIDAPLAVIRSARGRWRLRADWRLYARGEYRCIEVAGDRESMFERPHVLELSKVLSGLLRDAGMR